MRDRDRFVTGGLRVLQRKMSEAADSDDRDAIAGLRLRDPESAPHREPRAKDRCRLLIAHRVGNEDRRIRARDHELGVASLRLDAGADAVLAELLLAAQTPFASAARILNPRDSDAIADLAFGDACTELHDLADRFMS